MTGIYRNEINSNCTGRCFGVEHVTKDFVVMFLQNACFESLGSLVLDHGSHVLFYGFQPESLIHMNQRFSRTKHSIIHGVPTILRVS